MACSQVNVGSPGVQAMLNAFQDGSGLCMGSISLGLSACIFLGVLVLAGWYITGQYQEWSDDKSDHSYWTRILVAIAFIPLSAVLFLR